MARRRVGAEEFECDGCGRVLLVPDTDPEVYGFHGSVTHVHTGGGDGGDWFACRESCIRKAVLASLRRDNS